MCELNGNYIFGQSAGRKYNGRKYNLRLVSDVRIK